MTDQHERDRQLDDLLDALIRGEELPELTDDELAELVETAQHVRTLAPNNDEPIPGFPARLAAFLERELQPRVGRALPDYSSPAPLHPHTGNPMPELPIPVIRRSSWTREALRLVAAVAAFAIVGAILALVLRGDEPDVQVAAPSTSASPTVTLTNGLVPDESGIYRPESFAEAQTLLPFRLLDPSSEVGISGVFLATIEVQPSEDGDLNSPLIFQAMYARTDGEGAFGMEQREGACVLPDLDEPAMSTLQVHGKPIAKAVGIPQDFYTEFSPGYFTADSATPASVEQHPVAIYSWQRDGNCVMVGGMLQGGISEALLEQFVTTMLTPADWIAPTPDAAGVIRVTTFAEARTVAPYPLAEPSVGEYGIQLNGIMVQTDPFSPDSQPARVRDVVAYYEYGGTHGIEFHQRRGQCGNNNMQNAEVQTVTLGNKDVEETRGTNIGGLPLAVYQWEAGEICYMIAGAVPDDLALKRMQQLVEAVPVPATSSAPIPTVTPAPDALPHDDGRAVLDAWPNYGDGSEGVVVRGRGFMADTSVAITGNALGGDTRGPVAEAVVRSDGSFDVELTPEQLAEVCADALPDQACRIVATPGTMTQLTDPVGPAAYTVFVFGEDTPKVILERKVFPACGVDIALNGAQWDVEAGAAARDCLITAADAGQVAELIYVQQTIEGDLIVSIYRVNDDGTATILADATRDRFGVDRWTMTSCDADVQGDGEPAGPVFAACGEPVQIE